MKICMNCDQKFDDIFFRCKNCVQILVPESWFNSPRETKSPIKILEVGQAFGKDFESDAAPKWFSLIEPQFHKANSEARQKLAIFAKSVFVALVKNKIMTENEAMNQTKNFSAFSLAWASTCFIIGMESGKENLKDDQVFTYIGYITDSFTNYFLSHLWSLYNQKHISTEYYQNFISAFSLTCYMNALQSEKIGYLESFKVDDFKSTVLFSLNQIINKR